MNLKKALILFLVIALVIPPVSVSAVVYNLQPEDVIKISVAGYPDIEKTVVISSDGMITFPPLREEIKVEGLTIEEAGEKILEKLKKYIEDISHVQVTVIEYQGNKIFILGQVAKPGKYTFPVMPNVLEALIEAGGGSSGSASLRTVRILRGDKKNPKVIEVNIENFLETGNIALLPQLESGDTIYVPFSGEDGALADKEKDGLRRKNSVNIIGEVKAPGVYQIKDSLSLVEVLLIAGGPTDSADLRRIKIIDNLLENTAKEVNLKNFITKGDLSGNPPVGAGKTVVVSKYVYEGTLPNKEEPDANVVYLFGEIYRPGAYQLKNDANIWRTLQLAGGPTSEAEIKQIRIVKGSGSDDYPKTLVVDLSDYMKQGNFESLQKLESGDTVILPKKSHFWRETVRFFSEIAIIIGAISLVSE